MVPDPLMTDAEIIHRRARNPHNPHVGKVLAMTNMVTLIGALAFVRRRLSHHEKAAEWFKNAYEGLYGGMAPGIDLARVRVDFSSPGPGAAAGARIDRGRALRAVMEQLGPEASNRVIAATVLNIPCARSAPPGKSGKPSGRAIEREVEHLLAALDRVAEIRGFIATRQGQIGPVDQFER